MKMTSLKKTNIKKTAILLSLALLAAPALAEEMTLDQVIAKNIEARGGESAWQNVESARIEGKMVMAGAMELPMTMLFKRPNSVRIELVLQGQTMIQAFDGSNGWQVNPLMGKTEPQKMSEDEVKQVQRQAEFEGPLHNWKKKGHTVELMGQEEVDGTPAHKLKITMANGDVVYSFLDTEHFLEFKQLASATSPTGQQINLSTVVGDYKEVGDLVMAHSLEMTPEGAPQSMTISFDKVEINPELDSSLFTMPEPATTTSNR